MTNFRSNSRIYKRNIGLGKETSTLFNPFVRLLHDQVSEITNNYKFIKNNIWKRDFNSFQKIIIFDSLITITILRNCKMGVR